MHAGAAREKVVALVGERDGGGGDGIPPYRM